MRALSRLVTAAALAAAAALLPTGAAQALGPLDLGSSGFGSSDLGSSGSADKPNPTSTCFWFGPTFSATDQELNYAFPDSGALYWAAQFAIPEGAELVLRGDYAHARYQSLNSYDVSTNSPTAALNDVSTAPDEGSTNPYLPGANRDGRGPRAYTATVLNQTPPTDPTTAAANTLYAGVTGQERTTLLYRVYLPDDGRDVTGDAGLPEPELHLAGGEVLTGQSLCTAVTAATTTPAVDKLPLNTYLSLRDQPGKPATFPAEQEPAWRTFYNVPFGLGCSYLGKCDGTPARTGGQYSNIDNNYVAAHTNRGFGEVLTLTGTMPVTPRTTDGQDRVGEADMRYWSLCNNESMATTKVIGCLHDEQVPLDSARRYTIVATLPEDRPVNATEACGVAWLPLSRTGDGAGHPDDGYLLLRNMLPSAGFGQAVQNTHTPGDEKAVMGQYLPDGQYSSKADFEARGCSPLHR
ncbi:hypothetical protein O4215_14305 [Rhodococcus maanshanensis]|uniref:hypothetical protein n=1 Tax=Rhodococcus maanshanensis TaxID=183556 RepID=UPI0022B5104A|nr:hypothetical protein [Rhodococcus maanshanensis]MCZ4556740.1 hypothetical protein [Rhodococcus maanshanensis]